MTRIIRLRYRVEPTPTMKRQTPSIHVKHETGDFPHTEPVMDSIDENEDEEQEQEQKRVSMKKNQQNYQNQNQYQKL